MGFDITSLLGTATGLAPTLLGLLDRYRLRNDPGLNAGGRALLDRYNSYSNGDPSLSFGGMFGQDSAGNNIGANSAGAYNIGEMLNQNPGAYDVQNYQNLAGMTNPADALSNLMGIPGGGSFMPGSPQPLSGTDFSGAPPASGTGAAPIDPSALGQGDDLSWLFGGQGGGQGGGGMQQGGQPAQGGTNPLTGQPYGSTGGLRPGAYKALEQPASMMGGGGGAMPDPRAGGGGGAQNKAVAVQQGINAQQGGGAIPQMGGSNYGFDAAFSGPTGGPSQMAQAAAMFGGGAGLIPKSTDAATHNSLYSPVAQNGSGPQVSGGSVTPGSSSWTAPNMMQQLFAGNPNNYGSMNTGVQNDIINRGTETIDAQNMANQRNLRNSAASGGSLSSGAAQRGMFDANMGAQSAIQGLGRDTRIDAAKTNWGDLQNAAGLQLQGTSAAAAAQQQQQARLQSIVAAIQNSNQQSDARRLGLFQGLQTNSQHQMDYGSGALNQLMQFLMARVAPGSGGTNQLTGYNPNAGGGSSGGGSSMDPAQLMMMLSQGGM